MSSCTEQPTFFSLKPITGLLLSPDSDYNTIRESAISLKNLFCETIGFDDTDPANLDHILTESGLAVGPMSAAFCIIDFMRTRKFILGARDAIHQKLKTNPGKPVVVLYAGAGPFATLLTPLITLFRPSQLQMVLMEINPVSIGYLAKTIEQFGMKEYIMDIVQADVVTYSIPPHQQPDILVSETMKPGLQKEPQVSVVAHLLSQCNSGTILIPEHIQVDACLKGNRAGGNNELIRLQTLLELDAETALQIKKNPGALPVIMEGITITMNEPPPSSFTKLILDTRIRIFGNHWLQFNESSLTIPQFVMETNSIKKFPAYILFRYEINDNPGFRISLM